MSNRPSLALYHYDGCGFCSRVRQVIGQLGLQVELRSIFEPEHMTALVQATGRRTVPVLLLEDGDGQIEWLPESTDIILRLRSL